MSTKSTPLKLLCLWMSILAFSLQAASPTLNISLDAQKRPVLKWANAGGLQILGRDNLASGEWSALPNSVFDIVVGATETTATDKRSLSGLQFYQLKLGCGENKTLAAVDSPITLFEPDLAVDDTYVYFGTSHGEIFRVLKDGSAPAQRLTSVNVAYLVKTLLAENNQTLPEQLAGLYEIGILGEDLAVLGIAVDERNIYFTVNKILSVIAGDHPRQQPTENEDLHLVLPETGALFFIPKPGTLDPDIDVYRPAIPLVLRMDGAAGISVDETHLYWSCMGSQVTDLEELQAWLTDSGNIGQELQDLAVDTIGFRFRQNGKVLRRLKPTDQPQDWALELTIESDVLATNLALTSRNVALDNTRVYFGENGGQLFSYGPSGTPSAVKSVTKAGGNLKTVFESTNNMPAFLVTIDSNNVYFSGGCPIGAGTLLYNDGQSTREIPVPYFSFYSVLARVPKAGGTATPYTQSIQQWTGRSPAFSLTSTLKVEGSSLFFTHNYVAENNDLKPNGALRISDVNGSLDTGTPSVVTGDLKRPSTFAMDSCAFYITTHDKGTNTILRIAR